MAVTDVELHWNGATGSWTRERREYTAVYLVRTNSALDGPQTIIDYFYTNRLTNPILRVLGDSYAYGNDNDPWAYCTKIDPQRESRTAKLWQVVLGFETRAEEENGRDKNGDPTNNPLEYFTELEISKAQFQRAVEKAYNLTALPGRPVNTLGPVTNSAGTTFDPPLMRDDSHLVLRITKYMDHFPEAHARQFQDGINSKKWTLWLEFQQFIMVFIRHEAKLQNLGGSFHARLVQEGNKAPRLVRYWKNTYEIHQRDGGWIEEVVDRGLHARAEIGDPDGRGGLVGFKADGSAMDSVEFAAAFPAGTPCKRRLKDAWGENIDEPVLLDGKGQPLACGAPPVYIKYRTLKEFPFDALGISDPLP